MAKKENYILDRNNGKCTLTDSNTGLILEWSEGAFNETQKALCDQMSKYNRIPLFSNDARKIASQLAEDLREMADYIQAEYPELI